MAGRNLVILVGHTGRDPEVRYTANGSCVVSFSVATSEAWKDKGTGEKREKVTWHNIVCWNQLAEICGKYLVKGRQVYIEGKLQNESWEKDGVTRYTTKILASVVQFLGEAGQRQASPPASQPGHGRDSCGGDAHNTSAPPAPPPMPDCDDSDIPF